MVNLSSLVQGFKDTPEKGYRILAFGSSNTELFFHSCGSHNWVDWLNMNLRQNIGRNTLVINQGICGDTTEGLLERYNRDVTPVSPVAAIITIGGNDSMRNGMNGLTQYRDSLSRLIDRLLLDNIQPAVQTYYCPFYERCMPDFRPVFEAYMDTVRGLSREYDIPLIDSYAYMASIHDEDMEGYKSLMLDGMHVNAGGNFLMGEIVSRHFGLPPLNFPDKALEQSCTPYISQIREGLNRAGI